MDKKTLLGKIFISYSSKDKAFVRKLTKQIESQGYTVWLDEKELIAGDYLPKTIGEAIEKSRVSIVIVSNNSIKSGWVQHEISNAMDRMIKGQMRLIPVLIQDIKLPPELGGLVFADFRESFHDGLTKVLTALDNEASKYDMRRITKEPTFSELIEGILERTFGPTGIGEFLGEYKSLEFRSVTLDETDMLYEIVFDYGYKLPINQQWWNEFSEVMVEWGVPYVLLITKSPIGFDVAESLEYEKRRILLLDKITPFVNSDHTSEHTKFIIVDLSELDNLNDYTSLIESAKELIGTLLTKGKD